MSRALKLLSIAITANGGKTQAALTFDRNITPPTTPTTITPLFGVTSCVVDVTVKGHQLIVDLGCSSTPPPPSPFGPVAFGGAVLSVGEIKSPSGSTHPPMELPVIVL